MNTLPSPQVTVISGLLCRTIHNDHFPSCIILQEVVETSIELPTQVNSMSLPGHTLPLGWEKTPARIDGYLLF